MPTLPKCPAGLCMVFLYIITGSWSTLTLSGGINHLILVLPPCWVAEKQGKHCCFGVSVPGHYPSSRSNASHWNKKHVPSLWSCDCAWCVWMCEHGGWPVPAPGHTRDARGLPESYRPLLAKVIMCVCMCVCNWSYLIEASLLKLMHHDRIRGDITWKCCFKLPTPYIGRALRLGQSGLAKYIC